VSLRGRPTPPLDTPAAMPEGHVPFLTAPAEGPSDDGVREAGTPTRRLALDRVPLALFTVAHPGSLPYFGAFYRSVVEHADPWTRLWIASDGVSPADLEAAAGGGLDAEIVMAPTGTGANELRVAVLARLCRRYPAIILIDSDDVLLPGRTLRARRALERADVAACAMTLIDDRGLALPGTFRASLAPSPPRHRRTSRAPAPAREGAIAAIETGRMPPPRPGASGTAGWGPLLARMNVFGFGNAAYRSDALQRALTPPPSAPMLDWHVATRALGLGASLSFDEQPGIAYRLHDRSSAPILPPFSASDLADGTSRVLRHYRSLLGLSRSRLARALREEIDAARVDLELFRSTVIGNPDLTGRYLAGLNAEGTVYRWWEWIACRRYEHLWKT
jgi:hypothetical protein